MATYSLDLTGLSTSNRITNEIHEVTKEGMRIFIPEAGAFYTRGLVIRNTSNGQLLQPITQYTILNLLKEPTLLTGKEICSVILIRDLSITNVSITYQCIGGQYQYIASTIQSQLKTYLDGTTTTDIVGSLIGLPVQFPPSAHLHRGDTTTYGFNDVITTTNRIHDAIIAGDGAAEQSIYQFIDRRINEVETGLVARIAELSERVVQLDGQTEVGISQFIFTDNPENPAVRLGYGEWVLNPDVFLYGANLNDTPGELIYIDEGAGQIGRLTYIWQRVRSTGSISYSLTSSTGAVNEGDSITFTLVTTGLTSGTTIPYTLSGVNSNDMVGGLLKGKFIVGPTGVGTSTITIREDNLTDGNKTLKIRLTNIPSVFINVTINDTSLSPAISLAYSANSNGTGTITSVAEGSTIYLVVTGTNVPVGTEYDLLYTSSTVNANDFVGTLPVKVVMNAPKVIIPYVLNADRVTEGNELLAIAVTADTLANALARLTLTINDTSVNPTYSLNFSQNSSGTGSITSIDEGMVAYMVVSTTEVDNGTVFNLSYSGTATDDDFTGSRPSTVTVNNGRVIVPYAVSADTSTEGTQTMVVNLVLNGTSVANKVITINDTSISPSYSLKFSSNASGTDSLASVNEGTSIYSYFKTTNVQDNTLFTLVWGGTAVAADFTTALPTSARVSNGTITVPITIKADVATEGAETLTVSYYNNGVFAATSTININDTSVMPTYAMRFSSSSSGIGTITSVNEGYTAYLVIETTNVTNGDNLALTYSSAVGNCNANDIVQTRPTTVSIINNKAIVPYTLKNDLLSEGTEILSVSLRETSSSAILVTADVTVVDTSVPTFNAYFSDISGNGVVTKIGENADVYLVIDTQGVPVGTMLTLDHSGSTTNASDFTTFPSNNSFGTLGDKTSIKYTVANDFTTEGTELLSVVIKQSGNAVASASVTIDDTSKTLGFDARWSSASNGAGTISNVNEGGTIYYVLETQNVPNGSVYDIAINGGTATAADFTTLPTTITVNSNKGIAGFVLANDTTFEGTESLTVRTKVNGNFIAPATIDINDTSVPSVSVKFQNTSGADITAANEGDTINVVVDTRATNSNTLGYQLVFSGTSTAADFDVTGGALAGATTYNKTSSASALQTYTMKIIADQVTDGNKTLKVDLNILGISRASDTLSIVDYSKNPSYDTYFASDSAGNNIVSSVNEGDTVYLIVKTTNVNNGTNIYFNWSGAGGVQSQWQTTLPTSVSISSNKGSVALTAKADLTDDGVVSAVVNIRDSANGLNLSSANIAIQNNSVPTYEIIPVGSSSANEGDTLSFQIRYQGSPADDTVYLSYSGTATQADFVEVLPATTWIKSGTPNTIGITVKNDLATEGNETFVVTVRRNSANGPIVGSTSFTINDTSLTAGYNGFFARSSGATSSSAVGSVGEGETFYYIIETQNVANGKTLNLNYGSGGGYTDSTDFTTSLPSSVTVNSNRAVITLTTKADSSLEGNETLRISVADGGTTLVTSNLTITDNSVPTYSILFSLDPGGTQPITLASEGDTFYICLVTTGAAGQTLHLNYSGSTTTAADWDTQPASTILIGSDGKGWVAAKSKPDLTAEGNEVLVVNVRTSAGGSNLTSSAVLTLYDTSVPTYYNYFATDHTKPRSQPVSSVNEGASVAYVIETNGMPYGSVFDLTYSIAGLSASQVANQFDQALPAQISIGSDGRGWLYFSPKWDELTDGNMNFAVTLKAGGVVRCTASVTIVDDSKTPTFNVWWSTQTSGTPRVTASDEGNTVYLIVQTTNIRNNTIVQVKWDNSQTNSDDFVNAPAGTVDVLINNGMGWAPVEIKNDFLDG